MHFSNSNHDIYLEYTKMIDELLQGIWSNLCWNEALGDFSLFQIFWKNTESGTTT